MPMLPPDEMVAHREAMREAEWQEDYDTSIKRLRRQFKGFGVAVLMLHAGRIAREIAVSSGKERWSHVGQASYCASLIFICPPKGAATEVIAHRRSSRPCYGRRRS